MTNELMLRRVFAARHLSRLCLCLRLPLSLSLCFSRREPVKQRSLFTRSTHYWHRQRWNALRYTEADQCDEDRAASIRHHFWINGRVPSKRFPALQKFYSRFCPRITDIISEKRISFVLWTKCARRLEIFGITIIFNNFFFFCVELSIFAVVHFSVETDAWT